MSTVESYTNYYIETLSITNVYLRQWWKTDVDWIKTPGVGQSRRWISGDIGMSPNTYTIYESDNKSEITYDVSWGNNDTFYLDARLLDTTSDEWSSLDFTDNNIYEFNCYIHHRESPPIHRYPGTISNRSFISCVIPNVPDNDTLNSTDWSGIGGSVGDYDGDSLSDWTELYVTFTIPFFSDTDNDGINDYWENLSGSDPNNYTETFNVTVWQSIDFSINGSCYNVSTWGTWQHIDFSVNGSAYNSSTWGTWRTIDYNITGSCYNTSTWGD